MSCAEEPVSRLVGEARGPEQGKFEEECGVGEMCASSSRSWRWQTHPFIYSTRICCHLHLASLKAKPARSWQRPRSSSCREKPPWKARAEDRCGQHNSKLWNATDRGSNFSSSIFLPYPRDSPFAWMCLLFCKSRRQIWFQGHLRI